MKTKFHKICWFWMGLLYSIFLAGCTLPGLLSTSSFDSETVIEQKATISWRMTETVQSAILPTSTSFPVTATAPSEVQCTYVWTLKQDDDLSILFSSALPDSVSDSTELGVTWYGENCINIEKNELVRFYASTLEITVLFAEGDIQSEQWMGEQIVVLMDEIEEILLDRPDLEEFPILLHFVFDFKGELQYLNFNLEAYRLAHDKNDLMGEELYSALFE
ncbi:MAG: hypothetical protein JEZ00_21210 [Anaerolineaceae bacterium]|nr:hypothetical protein [Anaerolineaceae bacterium]